jgi:RNA polymerase sigma factor for flagellar operon FliA
MSLRHAETLEVQLRDETRESADEHVTNKHAQRHSVMPRPSVVPPRTHRQNTKPCNSRVRHAAVAREPIAATRTTGGPCLAPELLQPNELLAVYTPLVRQIAGGFQRRLPRNVLREDLIAAGMSGLWDAITRYGDKQNEGFEWYVRVRIRGAILDELRAQDWLPRRARAAQKQDGTVAPSVVRFDDVSEREQRSCLSTGDLSSGEVALDAKFTQDALVKAVDQLPERERLIVSEHYFKGVKFKDLGLQLGVSDPRISQLHSRAMTMLKTLMDAA